MKQRPEPLPKYDATVAIDALAVVLASAEKRGRSPRVPR